MELGLRPVNLNIITTATIFFKFTFKLPEILDYATQLTTISAGTIGNFRVYNSSSKLPLNFSPTLP